MKSIRTLNTSGSMVASPSYLNHRKKGISQMGLFLLKRVSLHSINMIKKEDLVTMRAVALCHKPYLKPEEALIYTNLARTQFAKKCSEYGVYKTNSGYYKKEDLDRMMSGEGFSITQTVKNLKVNKAS